MKNQINAEQINAEQISSEPSRTNKDKTYTFASESEREIAVCIAIQKLGKASVQEIIEFVNNLNSRISEKQVDKCAENLRAKSLLSIDLSEKDSNGISIKRYLMKKIKLAVPEVAQMKDLVHDESLKPLIDELDRSKGTRKKGLKTNDYYKIEVTFDVEGDIQGFVPSNEDDGTLMHYRDSNEDIVFYGYHFQNWFRDNLPLINRSSSCISDMRFFVGHVNLNNKHTKIIDRWITNIDSGFHSSHGTGGRGARKVECLPENTKVITAFCFPRELIDPEKVQQAFQVICENAQGFGGNHKLSTGRLVNPQIKILNDAVWSED
jgi:hypothetical protein